MRRRVLTVCALAVGALALPVSAHIVDRLDQPAPVPDCTRWWNGEPPRMKDLAGQVVILHLHDPNRVTSKAFEGKVAELQRKHAERPFRLIEIIVATPRTSEADAASYVERAGASWAVGFDGKAKTAGEYPGTSVPRTYLIGPDGRVVWHAHLGALTDEVLEAQFERTVFWSEELPRKARKMAKAARSSDYGKALAEARRVLDDERNSGELRAVAEAVVADVDRMFELQWRVAEALEEDFDWGVLHRRVERMREVYADTPHEDRVESRWEELKENPRVRQILDGERMLDRLVAKTESGKKRDLEAGIREIQVLIANYGNTKVAEKAERILADWRKRLAE